LPGIVVKRPTAECRRTLQRAT